MYLILITSSYLTVGIDLKNVIHFFHTLKHTLNKLMTLVGKVMQFLCILATMAYNTVPHNKMKLKLEW